MKTLLITMAAMIFGTYAIAQNSSKPEGHLKQQIQPGDSVLMKEGNVWLIQNGKRTKVTSEVIIGGTKVQADGAVIFKDGSASTLQEGDVVLSDGKLVRAIIKVSLEQPRE